MKLVSSLNVDSSFVSVAMTTYNGRAYVLEQLQSIYDQSRQVDEVVICDDRSTDDTVSLVKDFIASHKLSSWKIVVNEKQLGFCDNFWKAISMCTGGAIFLSDQDDVWYRDKVAEMLSVMEREDAVLVSSSHDICDSKGTINNQIKLSFSRLYDDETVERITIDYMIGRSPIRGCTLLFKKEILDNEELISLSNGLGHDWYIVSLAAIKGNALFFNKKLFKYRVHGANTSSRKIKFNKRTAPKIVKKRLDSLEEGEYALKKIVSHDNVDDESILLIDKYLRFLRMRSKLLNNLNLLQIIPLIFNKKAYVGRRERGILDGFKPLCGDIAYALTRVLCIRDKR